MKNGTVNRHVYYTKDHNCKNPPINETDLIKQFENLINMVDLRKVKIQNKIKEDILRIKKFNKFLLNTNTDIKLNDIDMKNYVKFVLREGEMQEKRYILENICEKILLNNKK